jgi:8-amino-7-oxononanoate synthase
LETAPVIPKAPVRGTTHSENSATGTLQTTPYVDIFRKAFNYTRAREARESGFYPYFIPIEGSEGTEVLIDGEKKIMIGSNNYLGLPHDPWFLAAPVTAPRRYGSGCTGSRFLNGTLDMHIQLENDLAEFIEKEAALVFSTGFHANLGTISTLVGKDDVVVIDKLDHASIVDGCFLSPGRTLRYRHNDLEDLERVLNRIEPDKGRLIAIDGVFSMEGDIAPLPEIHRLARKYSARILCDDAHSLGVLGPRGNGTAAHFKMTEDIDLVMGTFSKSFASIGGVIAGDARVIDYLKHHARPMIFSASLPPYAVATVHKCLDIIKQEPERRARLWQSTRRMKEGFGSLGFDTSTSETPIIPIIVGDISRTFVFWKSLLNAGIFANAVIPPAVPENACRIRTSYMATHTEDHLDFVLETFARIGKQVGLI